jgi:hypothetical protein
MALRCLLVDDDAHFLESARALLQREGMQEHPGPPAPDASQTSRDAHPVARAAQTEPNPPPEATTPAPVQPETPVLPPATGDGADPSQAGGTHGGASTAPLLPAPETSPPSAPSQAQATPVTPE